MDFTPFTELGIAGLAGLIVFFGYKVLCIFVEQWKISNEVVKSNALAQHKLADVLENTNRQSDKFHAELVEMMQKTYKKVTEIHTVVACEDSNKGGE